MIYDLAAQATVNTTVHEAAPFTNLLVQLTEGVGRRRDKAAKSRRHQTLRVWLRAGCATNDRGSVTQPRQLPLAAALPVTELSGAAAAEGSSTIHKSSHSPLLERKLPRSTFTLTKTQAIMADYAPPPVSAPSPAGRLPPRETHGQGLPAFPPYMHAKYLLHPSAHRPCGYPFAAAPTIY